MKLEAGKFLFHNSSCPVTVFLPTEGVVYFGGSRKSITNVGGTGYLNKFQITTTPEIYDEYGGRTGWGKRGGWISAPATLANECLQHISSEEV